VEARVARWLDVVAELMLHRGEFPYERLSQELAATFDVEAVSWNWQRNEQDLGFVLTPERPAFTDAWSQQLWDTSELARQHPLVRWFLTTRDPTPQTMGRVPTAISPRRSQAMVREILRPFDANEQLSIPYVLDAGAYRAFVLCRTGADFDDDDLAVATRLRPALAALDAQARLLSPWSPGHTPAESSTPALTGRELAVLRLLCWGHTAHAMAHRLGCTPRTVEKHLEHVYRKLGVNDRLGAVQRAAELHMMTPEPVQWPTSSERAK
jgi:DNA-binding CsgD family transcriptional regulator